MKRVLALLLTLILTLGLFGCGMGDAAVSIGIIGGADGPTSVLVGEVVDDADDWPIDPDGWFYSKEDVSLYIHTFGWLPSNFITKDKARDLGWEGGSVEDYAPGYAIGGDVFQNREGLLPDVEGRIYYECDIDTNGYHSRGSRRIVFSNDGLIYYSHNHYESFELLYGEE